MKQNEPLSSLTHLIGVGLAVAALVLLIVFAALKSTAWHVVTFSIFGASMILLYLASTLYHFFCKTKKAKSFFMKLDHAMIYVLIAGTYTPICLVPLRGPWGWTLFGIVWGLAILGIVWKFTLPMKPVLSTLLYLLMGWIALIAFVPLLEVLTGLAWLWLGLGGVLYSLGTIFYALDIIVPRTRWFGMHEVWHLFVIAGSFCHFWLMLRHVLFM